MSAELATPNGQALQRPVDASILEKVLAQGDLSKLSSSERLSYFNAVCQSVGLNPLTRPFEFITLNNKLTMYARKDATDQLRSLHTISVQIVDKLRVDDLYIVTARAQMPDGRQDEEIGAVSILNKRGDDLANAMMKAVTKAKRRVTLSICGLGMLDETELETIPTARPVTPMPARKVEARTEAKVAMDLQAPVEPQIVDEPAVIPESDEEPVRAFVDGEAMSAQQRKMIWALATHLFGNEHKDPEVHAVLWEIGKVQSIEHLSKKGASLLIERLQEMKNQKGDA